MISVRQCLVAVVLFSLFATPSIAQEKDYVPQSGTFAPMDKSRYIAGELVYIDPVNRRGGIRLDGDEKGRYFTGPLHYFALLPYATVWHNGALAEIRDIPIGTAVFDGHVQVMGLRAPQRDKHRLVSAGPNNERTRTGDWLQCAQGLHFF